MKNVFWKLLTWQNAILKSNGFIIGRDIFSTEVVRKLTAV